MLFEQVIGQERVVRVLQRALSTGNLPHAYLFYGTEGVGRFKTALALAGALFCREAEQDACGECPDCRRLEKNAHPGLSVIRPQAKKGGKEWVDEPELGVIHIEQIRELQKWFAVRSFEGGWRMCILDGAHKMNDAAANALLKTLEEPPPESLLVLVSPGRTQLTATVVSRCQDIYFAPLSRGDLEEFLRTRTEDPPEALSLVAALAEGSVGKALRLDSTWVSEDRRQWIQRLVKYTTSREGEATVDLAAELAECDRLMDVLNLFLLWYKDLMVCSGVGDRDRLLNRDLIGEIEEISDQGDTGHWFDKMKALQQTKTDIERRKNLNPRLLMEDLLFKLAEPAA